MFFPFSWRRRWACSVSRPLVSLVLNRRSASLAGRACHSSSVIFLMFPLVGGRLCEMLSVTLMLKVRYS